MRGREKPDFPIHFTHQSKTPLTSLLTGETPQGNLTTYLGAALENLLLFPAINFTANWAFCYALFVAKQAASR